MGNRFYIQIFGQVVICFALSLFCFLILLDGIVDYRTWRPIIFILQFLLLPIWLFLTHRKAFRVKENWSNSFVVIISILISDLLILLMGIFSFLIWLDLADGKTDTLLP